MYALSYFRPGSLDEPIAFLKWHPEAKPLSGGMTLIPTLMQRLAAPSHLVDLTWLPELKGITFDGTALHIGAATPHAEVAASDVVANAIPVLAKLAGLIADPQARNRGTIGGSVANNDPAAVYPTQRCCKPAYLDASFSQQKATMSTRRWLSRRLGPPRPSSRATWCFPTELKP